MAIGMISLSIPREHTVPLQGLPGSDLSSCSLIIARMAALQLSWLETSSEPGRSDALLGSCQLLSQTLSTHLLNE